MAFSLLVSSQGTGNTGAGGSGAIDTTGADLLVVVVARDAGGVVTDNKSNTWTQLTTYVNTSPDTRIAISYCLNPTVGTGHTFTHTASYAAIFAAAFSGAHATSSFDLENGANVGGSGTSLATGSVTPSEGNCLVIAGLALAGSESSTRTVNGGFTIAQQRNSISGTQYGGALAYLIQTTAAAANPTFSWTTSVGAAAAIASFKAAAGGGSNATPILMQMYSGS